MKPHNRVDAITTNKNAKKLFLQYLSNNFKYSNIQENLCTVH